MNTPKSCSTSLKGIAAALIFFALFSQLQFYASLDEKSSDTSIRVVEDGLVSLSNAFESARELNRERHTSLKILLVNNALTAIKSLFTAAFFIIFVSRPQLILLKDFSIRAP